MSDLPVNKIFSIIGDVDEVPTYHVPQGPTWDDSSTRYLIHLYTKYETEIEDPKKKEVWCLGQNYTGMKLEGFDIEHSKIDSKWRNLMNSHKVLRWNWDIVAKRHDINPPVVDGSENKGQTYFYVHIKASEHSFSLSLSLS